MGIGKTLVLVKLIEVLQGLIQRGKIPPHDILVLSCRDDLIEQLKQHVHQRKIVWLLGYLRESKQRKEGF